MQHCWEITTGRGENGWLHIRAVSFVFIYLDLMHNHPFVISGEILLNYLQTVETLLKCHILWVLILVATVCQFPF